MVTKRQGARPSSNRAANTTKPDPRQQLLNGYVGFIGPARAPPTGPTRARKRSKKDTVELGSHSIKQFFNAIPPTIIIPDSEEDVDSSSSLSAFESDENDSDVSDAEEDVDSSSSLSAFESDENETPSSSKPSTTAQDTTAEGKKTPALRRSTRVAKNKRPTSSFTPARSNTPAPSRGSLQDSPDTRKLLGRQDVIDRFVNCFPGGHERENVSGDGWLCGLRAVGRSVELQFGITAPTVEELHAIAQGLRMQAKELHFSGDDNVRSLDNNYSVDQLACFLQLWCEDHQQDLVLGCLMSTGLLNLYDNDNTTADTGIVWIYSSNNGRATADEYTDHYEALRRPIVPSSPDSKNSSSLSNKRPSDFSPSASTAESSAKKQRVDEPPSRERHAGERPLQIIAANNDPDHSDDKIFSLESLVHKSYEAFVDFAGKRPLSMKEHIPTTAVVEDTYFSLDWNVDPNLGTILNSPTPPTLSTLKSLTEFSSENKKVFAVYLLILEKLDSEESPLLYVGTGTNATQGVHHRFRQHNEGTNIPKHARPALQSGYEITHRKILISASLPDPLSVFPTRAVFLVLETALTYAFYAYEDQRTHPTLTTQQWIGSSIPWKGLCSNDAWGDGLRVDHQPAGIVSREEWMEVKRQNKIEYQRLYKVERLKPMTTEKRDERNRKRKEKEANQSEAEKEARRKAAREARLRRIAKMTTPEKEAHTKKGTESSGRWRKNKKEKDKKD